MNIEDKELLINELEEHLAQVSKCTIGNPFRGYLNEHKLYDTILSSDQVIVTSLKRGIVYNILVDDLVDKILSKQ